MTVSGTGWSDWYQRGERVAIQSERGQWVSAGPDANGAFSVQLTIDANAAPGPSWVTAVYGNGSGASQTFTVTQGAVGGEQQPQPIKPRESAPAEQVSLAPDPVGAGKSIKIIGSGFTPGNSVIIEWCFDGPLSDFPVVEEDGSFTLTVTVPVDAPVGTTCLNLPSHGTYGFTVTPSEESSAPGNQQQQQQQQQQPQGNQPQLPQGGQEQHSPPQPRQPGGSGRIAPGQRATPGDGQGAQPRTGGLDLPFPPGTSVKIGGLGVHGDNFSSMLDDTSKVVYSFANSGDRTALDIILNPSTLGTATVPTTPISSGTVLAVWKACQLVLVDHGSGTWAMYLHLQNIPVKSGQSVTPQDPLGYVTTDTPKSCRGVHSDAQHVHFALLEGSGTKGTYVSPVGRSFCGHKLTENTGKVGLEGLVDTYGKPFTVPGC